MINFGHRRLGDSDIKQFAIGWKGNLPDGWEVLDEPLRIQFRRGNKDNSDVVANAEYEIADSIEYGTNGALIITVVPEVEPLPENYLYFDIKQDNGIIFGYGSIEIIRGVTE